MRFMYQALYRKSRPRTFDDIVGQEHVSETLRRQAQSDRLSHAYLFVGTRGTGKTSCARILAKAINCLSPVGGNPCNKCAACTGIDNGSILDVTELDAASNNGVDHIRMIREEAVLTPIDVKKRVYIIDEVHMLSTAAFNALLKILEEPPEHLVFILATTELHKVPATILSRCQRYTFKRALPEHIARLLVSVSEKEGFSLTEDAAGLLARLADGSFRDALSLLDQCAGDSTVDYDRVVSALGLAGSDETAAILSSVTDNNVPEALTTLDRLYTDGKVMTSILEGLQNLVRDILMVSLMPKGATGLLSGGYDESLIGSFAKKLTVTRLMQLADILRDALLEISKGTGSKLAAEFCLIRMAEKRADSSAAALALRLAELEKALERGAVIKATEPSEKAFSAPVTYTPEKIAERPAAAPRAETTVVMPAPNDGGSKTPAEEASPEKKTDETGSMTETSKPAAHSGDLWADLLERIKPVIGVLAFQLPPGQVTASAEKNALVLGAKTPYILNMLNKPEISAAIRDALPAVIGKNLPVRAEMETANDSGSSDKLDSLLKFGNVTIEG
jgi:DNA polymerase-3 subunit gamma/tau